MKKSLLSLAFLSILAFSALVYFIAPYFADPGFIVVNNTKESINISAKWLDKKEEIGAIQPGASYEFSVNDEAAMIFTASVNNGEILQSTEIYFTSGTVVIAEVSNNGIEVRYKHSN